MKLYAAKVYVDCRQNQILLLHRFRPLQQARDWREKATSMRTQWLHLCVSICIASVRFARISPVCRNRQKHAYK